MSGEMNTSLGNGFTNAMVTLFMLREAGVTETRAVFEGDDGLIASPVPLTAAVPAGLGLRIKMEEYTDIKYAAFCGNRFDPDEKIIVRNPIECLASFGWTKCSQIKLRDSNLDALLRSKAYSLRYQYNGCPELMSFAKYVLRVTKRSESGLKKLVKSDRAFSVWERDLLQESLSDKEFKYIETGYKTRQLVQDLFGMSPKDQIELETYFDNLTEMGPLEHPILQRYEVHKPQWAHYFNSYQTARTSRMNPVDAIKGAVKNMAGAKAAAAFYSAEISVNKF